MVFDSDTSAITFGKKPDFTADSGLFFIKTLRALSKAGNSSHELTADWKIIEKWLGCEGRGITKDDENRISKAWGSYIGQGLAPSFDLQPTFDMFSKQYKDTGCSFKEDKPPADVIEVFDRLLATDDELKAKRIHDLDKEQKKLKKILKPKKNLKETLER
jgi:hypothetical protein